MNWLAGKKTYLLAGATVVLSVLAMTEGWITTLQGAWGVVLPGLFAATRAGIAKLQEDVSKLQPPEAKP